MSNVTNTKIKLRLTRLACFGTAGASTTISTVTNGDPSDSFPVESCDKEKSRVSLHRLQNTDNLSITDLGH